MAKAAELNPRLYQELIDRVKNGQPLDDLLSKYDPDAIRDILEESTAEFTKNKHPFDLFEKPELFSKVKTKINPNLQGEHGNIEYFRDPKTGLDLPDEKITINLASPKDKGTLLHEAQHAYDIMSQPKVIQPVEDLGPNMLSGIKDKLELNKKITSHSDLKGLEEATEYMAKHYKPDVEDKFGKMKQMLNLERVVSGKALKTIAPLVKAAGIGAVGLAAAGIGNKAMAGDYTGAGIEAADLATDLTPVVGEVKMAVSPSQLGGAELPPKEQAEKERFNAIRKRLMNK